MTGTLITSEVDFDAEGKQQGYLRVPHSVHRSAYGWIPVPITVIRNGEGPTLVISAGVHGDEYEGQIAVATLARELVAGGHPRTADPAADDELPRPQRQDAACRPRRRQSQSPLSRRSQRARRPR